MLDADLDRIESELAAWRRLPGRSDAYAQHVIDGLLAEVRRLREVEREALRVLGAVVYYQGGGRVTVSDGALHDEYVVQRDRDATGLWVLLKAWPVEGGEEARDE